MFRDLLFSLEWLAPDKPMSAKNSILSYKKSVCFILFIMNSGKYMANYF